MSGGVRADLRALARRTCRRSAPPRVGTRYGAPARSATAAMPASGARRLRSTSTRERLQRRDVEHPQPFGARRLGENISRSIAARNAASVLPEPVGASSSVEPPRAIGPASPVCAGVGRERLRTSAAPAPESRRGRRYRRGHRGSISASARPPSTARQGWPFRLTARGYRDDTGDSGGGGLAEQLNILVIDDDESLRGLLVDIIARGGHQAVPVTSAEEGLELLPFWTFQVAFIDQRLPGMEGLVLGQYLRRNNPDMTIALVTGENDLRLERQTRALSIAFIPKPFNVQDIQTSSTTIWARDRARAASRQPRRRGLRPTDRGVGRRSRSELRRPERAGAHRSAHHRHGEALFERPQERGPLHRARSCDCVVGAPRRESARHFTAAPGLWPHTLRRIRRDHAPARQKNRVRPRLIATRRAGPRSVRCATMAKSFSNASYSSDLPSATERFLAKTLVHALSEGVRTPADFLRHFPPQALMSALDIARDLRARILAGTAGVHEKIAKRKSTAAASEDLQLALDESVCEPRCSSYSRVTIACVTWTRSCSGSSWSRTSSGPRRTATSRATAARRSASRSCWSRRSKKSSSACRTSWTPISFDELAARLPEAELRKLVKHALQIGRSGTALDETRLLEIVPLTELVRLIRSITPGRSWSGEDRPTRELRTGGRHAHRRTTADCAGRRAGPSTCRSRARTRGHVGQDPAGQAGPQEGQIREARGRLWTWTSTFTRSKKALPTEMGEVEIRESERPLEDEARRRVTQRLIVLDRLPPSHGSLSLPILLSIESMYADLLTLANDEEREACIRESFPNESTRAPPCLR